MQTIKTGVVIALLIAVCYGAFVALNAPEADIPDSIQEWANSQDLETLGVDVDMGFDLGSAQAVSPDSLLGDFAFPDNEAAQAPAGAAVELPSIGLPEANSTTGLAGQFEPGLPAFPSTSDLPPGLPAGGSAGNEVALGGGLPPFPTDGPAVPFNPNGTALPPPGDLVSTSLPGSTNATAGGNLDLPPIDFGGISNPNDTTSGSAPQGLTTDGLPAWGSETNNASTEVTPGRQPVVPELPFAIAREQALMKANSGQLKEALTLLSPFYNSPEIGYEEHKDLLEILDALTREVIYSARHLLEESYTTGPNETVASVAEKHSITPELLAAINGLGNSKTLSPGTTLKMISGPFRAQVLLGRGELTLFLGDLYAGRFPIEINNDPTPQPGVYEVDDRRRDRTYIAAGGAVIQADEDRNPFGGYWISLGGNLSIHGSPKVDAPELQKAGCISLAPLDAANVYDILVKHSQVEILR